MSAVHLNHICIQGRLAGTPEIKQISQVMSVVHFKIKVEGIHKDDNGLIYRQTEFYDVSAWNTTADGLAQYAIDGEDIIVDGKLTQKQRHLNNGDTDSTCEIEATRLCFLSSARASATKSSEKITTQFPTPQPLSAMSKEVNAANVKIGSGIDIGKPASDSEAVPF